MGELFEPGKHAESVVGESGVQYENSTVDDDNAQDGKADSIESNGGYNNGAQGE